MQDAKSSTDLEPWLSKSNVAPCNHLLSSSLRPVTSINIHANGDEIECDNEVWYGPTEAWIPKAVALCRHLWPSSQRDSLSVAFLGRGSFNKVFGISFLDHDGQRLDYVLRTPELEDSLPTTAAILEYLEATTDLKVPRVVSWNDTRDNPLGYGYIILTRLPGTSLDKVLPTLSQDQKIRLAQDLAGLHLQIEANTNAIAGNIRIHNRDARRNADGTTRVFVQAFGTDFRYLSRNSVKWDNANSGQLPLERLRHDPPGLSTNEIMLAIYRRRIYVALNKETPSEYLLYDFFEPCQDMIQDMVDIELFKPENNVVSLHHPDLMPRNIMVDFTPDIVITGILDWDGAMFAPRFAGRVLPRWMWRTLDTEEDDDEPLVIAENEPDSPENAEIKQAFEKAVGEQWLSEAADKYFPFARRVLHFSRLIMFGEHNYNEVCEWKEGWEALFQSEPSDSTSAQSHEGGDSASQSDEDDVSLSHPQDNGAHDNSDDTETESWIKSSPLWVIGVTFLAGALSRRFKWLG